MLKIWKVTFLLSVFVLLATIPAAISAQTESGGGAKMYLAAATTRTIHRANLDGSQLEALATHRGPGRAGFSDLDLDVVAGKMYWVIPDVDNDGSGRIVRANLDGSQSENLVAGIPDLRTNALALDVGAGKMYWANTFHQGDTGTSSIQRANLDGSQIEDLVTSGLSSPRGLDLDVAAGKMYWVDDGAAKIQRASLDGSQVEDLVVTGLASPISLALDVGAGKMYWVDIEAHKIQRANLDGSQVEDLVVAGLRAPTSIALDVAAGKMYWTDVGTNKVQRANLDGTQVEDLIISFGPFVIALDLRRTTEDPLSVNVSRAAGSENAKVRPGSPVSLTATFSRPVSGFALEDITVVKGVAGNLAGSGAVYTFDVTPNAIGEVTVDIDAGVATDAGGNGNTAAPRFSLGITYDDDGDGGISKNEAIAAVRDYFSDRITKAQTIGVIRLYFATPAGTTAPEPEPGTVASDRAALMAFYNATDGSNWADNSGWGTDATLGEWYGIETDSSGRVVGIDLVENSLSGPIPGEIGDLSSLQWLFLNNVDFECIAPGECPATSPSANELSGPIPLELGQLTNLESLYLGLNSLSGSIPSELADLSSLRELALEVNQLTGEIPSWLGNLTNLQTLSLSANDLTGAIPVQLANLTNLISLQLGHNQLTGPMPAFVGNLTSLEYLTLHDNQLTGSIPSSYGNLSNLKLVFLLNNQLSGCIPAGLRDVPRNDFYGQLPFCSQ